MERLSKRNEHPNRPQYYAVLRVLRGLALFFAYMNVFIHSNVEAQSKRLVLVTNKISSLPELSLKQIRQIYLGRAIRGEAITPLSNQTNDLLYEVFLQKVIFLSERDYEKRLITRTFQTGERRPVVHVKEHDLLQSLGRQPGSVTFMWDETAARYPELRVVKVLWNEQAN